MGHTTEADIRHRKDKLREWSLANPEKIRAAKERYRERQRLARLGERIPSNLRVGAGNAKYQELLRLEAEWLRGATICDICGQRHPPMKSDYVD